DIVCHHFQKARQGVLPAKFKLAQHSEIVFVEFEKGVLNQVLHQGLVDPSAAAEDASSNHASDHYVEATPEFCPQFVTQSFISRCEKKPHQLLVGIVLVSAH